MSDPIDAVLAHGQTAHARSLDDDALIELIHRVADVAQRAMDAPIRDGEAVLKRGQGGVDHALADLVNAAVARGVAWPALARHPLANRPWQLIGMIRDRDARAEAYRSEIHYAEQTAAALRRARGRWLVHTLSDDGAPTKIALAAELGVSRPTLDKWIELGSQA